MPVEITIPRLGWSMDEGTFGEWLKADGDIVNRGDMVYVLDGEKAANEIESFDSGRLCIPSDAPQPGESVRVGQVIGFLLAEGETPPRSVGASRAGSVPATAQSHPAGSESRRPAGPAARRRARELGIDLNAVPTPDPTGRVLCEDIEREASNRRGRPAAPSATQALRSSPRARRRAQELGIDWTQIAGTGRHGRIREADVVTAAAANRPNAAGWSGPETPGRHLPATRIRRMIVQRLSDSIRSAIPVTLQTRVDAGQLVALQQRLKLRATDAISPGYTDILLKLTAAALRQNPVVNSCWHNDGILQYGQIHIALAVDTPNGLVAPVIRNIDDLSLQQIAAQSRSLSTAARACSLNDAQLRGGTFTVSSLGKAGIDFFTPVLNQFQAATLGIGRIAQEPVVRNNAIVPGHMISLSLTFDHRVLDGAPAAAWLQWLADAIRDPDWFVLPT